jgi:Flp pilus assembly pilin Flp
MLRDERGASLIEYVLIIAFVSIAAVAALSHMGSTVNNQFLSNDANQIPG